MTKQISFLQSNETHKEASNGCDIELSVDGASRCNPGLSGAGIAIKYADHLKRYSYFLGIKTNNQAEYLALILGLMHIKAPASISITSDSLLLVKQIKGEYKVRNSNIIDLYSYAKKLLENFDYKIKHILREKNTEADKLANIAVDKKVEIPNDIKTRLLKVGIKI